MPPKARKSLNKSLSKWFKCESCQTILTDKDKALHTEKTCPPSSENWDHSYIKNSVLYSTLEEYTVQDGLNNVPRSDCKNLVIMSQSAMKLCELAIGDPVVIVTREGTIIVKTAWPTHEETLTSVFMTKEGLETTCVKAACHVVVEKLNTVPLPAQEVHVIPLNHSVSINEYLFQHHFLGSILSKGYKFRIEYYGKLLTFEVKTFKPMRASSANILTMNSLEKKMNRMHIVDRTASVDEVDTSTEDLEGVFKIIEGTKWCVVSKEKVNKMENDADKKPKGLEMLGGLQDIVDDLKQQIDIALSCVTNISGIRETHGVLLYGPPGVGKTLLAEGLAAESNAEVFRVHGAEVYSRFVGEAEEKLRDIFQKAKQSAPSIILLDNVDVLCPRRSSGTLEQEHRIVATLATQLDALDGISIMVIATTSKPDLIDSSLRRPGRIDREIEIPVPSPDERFLILNKLLMNATHTLTDNDITVLAQSAHGYVGADLAALCSRAAHRASATTKRINITVADMKWALTQVKPSAMREVLVHVPNVRWSDVGGQRSLKLKLRQAVQWPREHPKAFQTLGINPPRGVLMFGPPGCSKTLIAKALATESKLNFLSVKGPELFSKWVGESERAVREVFRKARQVAPAIVFLDELDALGGERSSGSSDTGNSVQERVVAQLLIELDGVEPLGDVTVLAATNRPDRIDKALLRPGRLDRVVYVPLPDHETRADILSIKLKHMPVYNDVNVEDLARCTDGYSGAELVAVCNEAAYFALEENIETELIRRKHFDAALNLVTPRTPASLLQLYERYITNNS